MLFDSLSFFKSSKISPTGPPGRYQKDPSPTVSEGISFFVGFGKKSGGPSSRVGKIIEKCILFSTSVGKSIFRIHGSKTKTQTFQCDVKR